jgi:hypothetical protein
MTLQEWEQEKDLDLDEQLTTLFRSVDAPAPGAGFVSRTMNAVRRTPLPQGRLPLRLPWIVPVGWTTLVAAAVAASYGAFSNQRLVEWVADVCSWTVALGIRAGMRFVQSVHTTSAVFDLLETMSRVVSHVLSTREAAGGLISMALVAALSLSVLNRLLFSEKGSSSW